jgi:hypothetical protein
VHRFPVGVQVEDRRQGAAGAGVRAVCVAHCAAGAGALM